MEPNEALLAQCREILAWNKIPPPPPAHLQQRVVGAVNANFIDSGTHTIKEFEAALAPHGRSIREMEAILDFGCGCGRIARRLAETFRNATVIGADIDEEAIAWCSQNLTPAALGNYIALPHKPPTSLGDAAFDFIYSISVFTHLNEEMQFAWLNELRRISKSGAVLILTVHGDNYASYFPPETEKQILSDGFYYNTAAGITDGLPEFYKNTYHTRAYIERVWSRYFEILDYLPLGCDNHQDLIVCRRN